MTQPTPASGASSSFKPLSRRHFLRGLGGVTVGLPFLEALAPRTAQAQTATTLRRFGVFFGCNGVDMSRWFPNGPYGALTDQHLIGTANESLVPFRSKLLIPRGIHMAPRGGGRDPGGGDDHGRCMAQKLTAFNTGTNGLALGPSIDYVLAQAINPGPEGARRPPLNLWVGRPGNSLGLDYISYRAAGQAIQAVNNPWDAYANLMSLNTVTSDSAEAKARILQKRQSVLDLVSTQFDRLRRLPLSSSDRQKLDMHFTAVREIEVTVSQTGVACLDPDIQSRSMTYQGNLNLAMQEDQYPRIADIQTDLFALALACDMTRVATMQWADSEAKFIMNFDPLNLPDHHHAYQHEHGFNPDALNKIYKWYAGNFAYLLQKMDAVKEADGTTLLDNTLIFWITEIQKPDSHEQTNMPLVLAGKAQGKYRTGRWLQVPKNTSHNNLLVTLLNIFGGTDTTFGDAKYCTGALAGIT